MATDGLMEEVQATHPWITFRLDLRAAGRALWLALGEVKTAVEVIAGIPLVPAVADRLQRVYLARGALATTAIEGNTLSEEEALAQVRGELHLPPSKAYLGREIQNIVDACNAIAEDLARSGPQPLSAERIRQFNAWVLKDLPAADGAVPGAYRDHSVGVARYRAAPPATVSGLTDRLCSWLNGADFNPPEDTWRVPWAILKAVAAHLYIAWIHPFGDGNGRTARLVEFAILLGCGVPTPTAHLLSNHYNATRTEYYRQLERASASGGEVVPFVTYAVRGLADGLHEQIQDIQTQQIGIVWENFIFEKLQNLSREVAARRRLLLLALTTRSGFVPRSDVAFLTPQVGRAYTNRTGKTLTRDLNALASAGLIVRDSHGHVKANVDALKTFMPTRF